jgi:hypothetical protein
MLYEDREIMIRKVLPILPSMKSGCEIGVYAGEFAQSLMRVSKADKLILIDAWELFRPILVSADANGNNPVILPGTLLRSTVEKKFAKDIAAGRCQIMQGWSAECIPQIENKSLDWVYIDADHSYEGCLRDLLLVEEKMKEDSFIMGHDYEFNKQKCRDSESWSFGVGKAVDEFCATRGWHIVAKGNDGCVSYCLSKNANRLSPTL